MITEILLIWLALSLAFAAGWAIRARMPVLLLALIPCVLLSACLPRIETVTVQQCELAPLEARPNLPAVEYIERGSLLCLDTENQMKALEREIIYRERVNYCEGAYEAVEERCGGGE